jgi:hypothetical protein
MGVAKATDIDRSVNLFADGLLPVLSSDEITRSGKVVIYTLPTGNFI